MFNIGGGELIVIAIVALVVLGPDRLPSAARDVGRMMSQLRSISQGFRDELKTAVDLDALGKQSEAELAAEQEAFRRGDAHVAERPPQPTFDAPTEVPLEVQPGPADEPLAESSTDVPPATPGDPLAEPKSDAFTAPTPAEPKPGAADPLTG